MYTTLPTFAHVGEQKPDKNDERHEREYLIENTHRKKMSSPCQSQSNSKLIKSSKKYASNIAHFTKNTISNMNLNTYITNQLSNASHRKHRARIKKHFQDYISDTYVRWKDSYARDPREKTKHFIITKHHKIPVIPNTQQIISITRNQEPMVSKKAKKSRKEAKMRKLRKEKEATEPKRAPTPPRNATKPRTRSNTKETKKKKKKRVQIVESEESEDDSEESSDSNEDTDDEPQDRTRPSTRENIFYYKVKLYSNGGSNPNKIFQQLLRRWFLIMRRGVPSFIVYSYRDQSNSEAIQDRANITANLQDLKKYFIGLKLKSTPGDVWFRIRCGFDGTPDEMRDATDWWFRENNGVFFRQPLQVPDTVRNIWLFMSHDRMDTTRLTEAIQAKAKEKSYPTAPFVLMFSAIRDGRKYDGSPRKHEKPIKALHVECAVTDFLIVRELFSKLYGHAATTYPLNVWMRYVLVPNHNQTTATREGILALRRRQADFPLSIEHSPTNAIATLDREVGKHGKTFREMIMEIKTKDDQTRCLFLGIDADRIAGGHVFTFAQDVEHEARDMAVQFGSYLAHEYCSEIFKCMESTAAAEAKEAKWDPTTYSAKSPEDESMQNLVEIVDGMGWLKKPQQPGILRSTKKPTSKSEGFQFGTDTSSIKTFTSQEKRKRDDKGDDDDDETSNDETSDDDDEDSDDESEDDSDEEDDKKKESKKDEVSTTNTNADQTTPSDMEISSTESYNKKEEIEEIDTGNIAERTDEGLDGTHLSSEEPPPPAQAGRET